MIVFNQIGNLMEYLPYTYLIGWSTLNKWYYGVEYGIKKIPCANPNNLWTTYFTSSNLVKYYCKTYGDPNIIQIRKIFCIGSIEERLEASINWEKRVLSKIDITQSLWLNGRIGGNIGPIVYKKMSMLRYGVENMAQSPEIKEKIKITNLSRYGVEHPSYSAELMQKKKENNIKKYGVDCNLSLPHVREKAAYTLSLQLIKDKRQHTILNKYGVTYISQNQNIKDQIAQTRKILSDRPIVQLIREYKRVVNIKLTAGWYQLSDQLLDKLLFDIQQVHGIFTIEELSQTVTIKKYSNSIKKLQERLVVQQIKKYKEKFIIKLGRSWDRKSTDQLEKILQDLELVHGLVN